MYGMYILSGMRFLTGDVWSDNLVLKHKPMWATRTWALIFFYSYDIDYIFISIAPYEWFSFDILHVTYAKHDPTWPAPSHYLNQCWNIVNKTPRNTLQWNFKRNLYIFILENSFKSVVWKMAAILSRPQCVNIIWSWPFMAEKSPCLSKASKPFQCNEPPPTHTPPHTPHPSTPLSPPRRCILVYSK